MKNTQNGSGNNRKGKFNFSKEWCEKAAKAEKGVGGLMACNPKFLEDIKTDTQPTEQLKNFMKGKFFEIRKIPGLSKVVQQQKEFIEQVNLTLVFLKAYEGNPDDFKLLIGSDVWEYYRFEECYRADNPEFMWECIDEMTTDIVYKTKNFKVTGNGLFFTLHFSKTKDKKFAENFEYLKKYGDGGEWGI